MTPLQASNLQKVHNHQNYFIKLLEMLSSFDIWYSNTKYNPYNIYQTCALDQTPLKFEAWLLSFSLCLYKWCHSESLYLPWCFFYPQYLSRLSKVKMFTFNTRGWDLIVLFQELKQVVLHESYSKVPLIKWHDMTILSNLVCVYLV